VIVAPFELAAMLGLIFASALFSAAETALFSLTSADERQAGERARALVARPRELMIALLLCNLCANALFFAFAASVASRATGLGQWGWNVGALLVLLLFGEVIPKALALGGRLFFARLGALPMTPIVAAARPLIRVVDRLLELMYRALGPAGREELGITNEALAYALEKSAERGLLLDTEASILAGLIELDEVRVRELMTPRVDMLLLDVDGAERADIAARALATKTRWIVVVDGAPDQIVGRVRLRDLLAAPDKPLRELLEPVVYVPEVASATHALQWLRERHVAEAVVVDEWGGTAGRITLEQIFEEVLGDLRVEGESTAVAVVPRGEGHFEVDGSLSIREWNEYFGHRVVPREFQTLAGFVTALLGRIPRTGDVVRSGRLAFVVREVRRRRVARVEVFVDTARAEEGAA
jgi:putative hemolysin